MQKEWRKGWKIYWLIRACARIMAPMNSERRANFSARNFYVTRRGAGTETVKALFPLLFLRNGTSIYTSRKIELTGALGIFLAGKCCCICVCFIKQFFLLVDIQLSQCPRWFFVPEIQAL